MITKIGGSLSVGGTIHLHPDHLPDLLVISEEEAKAIADSRPQREFVISWINPLDHEQTK